MQSKLLHEDGGKRTFAVILQTGDEAIRCLQEFAVKASIGGAQITAIGALSSARLAFFDWDTNITGRRHRLSCTRNFSAPACVAPYSR